MENQLNDFNRNEEKDFKTKQANQSGLDLSHAGYTETIVPLIKHNHHRKWKFFLAALGIIMLAELGYLIWNNYLSEDAKSNRAAKENYDAYIKSTNQYETAMKNDTYGGKTPQETLDMFIDALKKRRCRAGEQIFYFTRRWK